MQNNDWGTRLETEGVLWRMNHVATGAHAELTSGKHSDGYCNCAKIAVDPALTTEVATAMIGKLLPALGDERPDFVIGPAYGAITFAYEIARQLGVQFGFTEIEYTEAGKMQVLKRFEIPAGAKVLVVEDIKSTGGSANKTIEALEAAGISVLPVVGLIGNWSGEATVGNKQAIALFEGTMNIYDPESCPLCAAGGKAVRPKSHWDELAR